MITVRIYTNSAGRTNGKGWILFLGFISSPLSYADADKIPHLRILSVILQCQNNLKFVVLGSLFQLCAGLILAILLTHISKGGNILRVIYFIPCIISSMAICQIFSKMLSVQPQGLVCYVMEKLGMEPIALLANSHTALITITLIDGYKYCGLYMIIFYSAFVSISKDVIEASTMDGCNVFQQYRYIKLPLVKNIFSIVIVMLVNGCLKTFDVFYILDNKSRSTEMVATYMYKTAFNSADFGYRIHQRFSDIHLQALQ